MSSFSDVPADAYYAPYGMGGEARGHGWYGRREVLPDALINREQMAVFFVRYFEKFDVDYTTDAGDHHHACGHTKTVSPFAGTRS